MANNPIVNSPYREPVRHFKSDEHGLTDEILEYRRDSSFYIPVPRAKTKEQKLDLNLAEGAFGSELQKENEFINKIRIKINDWRKSDYQGLTKTSRDLLYYWNDESRENKLFFCQIEALETLMYINEVAEKSGDNWIINELKNVNSDANPGLYRLAFKMATGSGKTVVMAMIIAYHTLNKIRYPQDTRFTDAFVIITPGITIRDRLNVLLPNDHNSYYKQRDIVSIQDLELLQQVVESERLEFKEGWNPEAVLHTMCAFANDINNWGGGYIVIGVAEKKNIPVFPPKGLSQSDIAKIQKELLGLSYKIRPEYFPVVEVTKFENKDIVIIWVPGGYARPYKAAKSLTKGAEYAYYIRRNSTTKVAAAGEERDLIKLANNIPFDDRINHNANLNDLNVTLIQSYLAEIQSGLLNEVSKIPFSDLCVRMNIAQGSAEYLKPKNIGLLLFNDNPEKFFPRARIDIVEFEDDEGDVFAEKIFTGPIHQQVRSALGYLKNSVIKEFVRKIPGKAEADRFYNYPYEALEEALVNAVYHKSYEEREPVEVRVYSNRILILSYPGPIPPLGKDNINKPIVTSHRYRNSRLGDFFKELHLTEGRCTGFPKIRKALKRNGSPPPIFETDNDREYFMATIKMHPKAKEKVVEKLSSNQKKIIEVIANNPAISAQALSKIIGISSRKTQDNIAKLKNMGRIKRIGPDKGGHWLVIQKDIK